MQPPVWRRSHSMKRTKALARRRLVGGAVGLMLLFAGLRSAYNRPQSADRMRDDSHERYDGPPWSDRRRYLCPKIFRRGFGSRGRRQPASFSDVHLLAADVRDGRRLRYLAGKLTAAT